MKKLFVVLLVVSLSISALISCGKKNEKTRDVISGSVMLYSSMDENILMELKRAFETKYPGVTMDYYFSTSDRVSNRLFAENSVGQFNCDVIWSGSQLDFEKYKNEGYLIPYKPKDLRVIHKTFREKENYYTGARAAAVGFGYLSDKGIKIKNYNDLLSDSFNSKIVMPDPDRAFIVKLFVAALMQNKNYGEDYFKKLLANNIEIVNSADNAKKQITNGKKDVCLTIDYLNTAMKEEGDTFTFSYPTSDVVFYYTPVGLAKDCYNIDNAKLLIDFILSKEGQNIIVSNGELSTRKDLKSIIKTERYFSRAMKYDLSDLYNNIDSYMSKFNSLR